MVSVRKQSDEISEHVAVAYGQAEGRRVLEVIGFEIDHEMPVIYCDADHIESGIVRKSGT